MLKFLARIARLLLFGVIAFVVIGVGALWFTSQPEIDPSEAAAQAVIDATVVRRGDLDVTINATGAVTPQDQVPLFFEASGRVIEIAAREGDRVAEGDLIARLDTSALDSSIAEAEIAVELQRIAFDALSAPARTVDVAVAQAAVDAAEAALGAAYSTGNPNADNVAALQADLARNQLYQAQLQRDIAANSSGFTPSVNGFIPEGVEIAPEILEQLNRGVAGLFPSISGADPDQFTAGLTQAEYGVQIADANAAAAADSGADAGSVASANAGLVAARVALDRLANGADANDRQAAQITLLQAQNALDQARAAADRARLLAPFTGVIAQNNLNPDEPPPSQNAAVLLLDDSALYIDLAVDETDVVDLILGQPVALRFDALPDADITGAVAEIAVVPVRGGGLVTYGVRVRLDPTDQPVRIGMSATATVIVRSLQAALIVPNRFIRIDRTSGDAFVTIEGEPGIFDEVRVRLGVRNATESEVTAGVEEGVRIVVLPRGTFDPFD